MIPGELQAELKNIWGDRVLFNEPMERHTSMGVGGSADAVIYPRMLGELRKAVDFLQSRGVPYLPLGNGTNLIVKDGGYRGVFISLERMNGFRFRNEERSAGMLTAEAGFDLADLVRNAAEAALAGVEFLAGIPGTLGGAIRMNAGAYGHDISEIVRTVYLVNGKADLVTLGREDLRFRYRGLELPPGSVIAGADLELRRDSTKDIRRRMKDILEQRKKKHPQGIRSAGSIFKNAPGMPAGRIIEESGLKGMRIGDAQVSEMHGNFIVNLGSARAADIIAVMEAVRKKVLESKGVLLEPEVEVVGDAE